jgi:hypothetical protein
MGMRAKKWPFSFPPNGLFFWINRPGRLFSFDRTGKTGIISRLETKEDGADMDIVLLPWVIAATLMLFIAAYLIFTVEKRVNKIESRYQRLLALAEDADQATIARLLTRLDGVEGQMETLAGSLGKVNAVLPHTLQGYGIVRYRAFPDVGGDQSFSIALVDVNGSGMLVTSLHGRDETRIYAKPLIQWRSSYSLSAEEQQALGQARQVMESGSAAPEAQG